MPITTKSATQTINAFPQQIILKPVTNPASLLHTTIVVFGDPKPTPKMVNHHNTIPKITPREDRIGTKALQPITILGLLQDLRHPLPIQPKINSAHSSTMDNHPKEIQLLQLQTLNTLLISANMIHRLWE